MKNFKFPESTVWFVYGDEYKAFVPNELVKDFQKFADKNKFVVKVCGAYNYTNMKKKTKDRNDGILREGKDYIIKKDIKDNVVAWLKSAYKEIN